MYPTPERGTAGSSARPGGPLSGSGQTKHMSTLDHQQLEPP